MSGKVESVELFHGMSISQLARISGRARETVGQRLEAAGVAPCGKRGGYPIYRPPDALAAIFQTIGDDVDPDKLRPFERNAWYKAEREKLHLELERGDVVPALEVERQFGALFKVLVQGLDTLPDVLERDVGATPKQLTRIEKHLDELRNSLYTEVVTDDADSADEKSA